MSRRETRHTINPQQDEATTQTIADFGEQWLRFQDNEGYYGSLEVLRDILEPLLPLEQIRGRRVAEIGSGTGRIVRLLAEAGAAHIVALEPSAALPVLKKNTQQLAVPIDYIHAPGEQLPAGGNLDFVFSIGVIHHIPTPAPVLRAAFAALKPGGQILIWLYGKEGNALYLSFARPVRLLTRRLPDSLLVGIARLLTPFLSAYARACRYLPLPMAAYMQDHILRLSPQARMLTIYDQLNPYHVDYYTREEAQSLLHEAGFEDIQLYHRHGYSWTVKGRRPEQIT